MENKVLKAKYGSDKTPLQLGELSIPCYVLEDGTRVFSGRGIQKILGSTATSGKWLEKFVNSDEISPYLAVKKTGISSVLDKLSSPIKFYRPSAGGSQSETYGYEVTLLIDICDAIISSSETGKFNDESIIKNANIIIRAVAKVGIIALVIIFQPELRRALEQLGRKKILFGLFRFNDGREKGERFSSKTAEEIVRACFDMGAAYTGALIVEQDMVLEEYEKTGITVDGLVTSQLLINIFEHNTPLHDGAVIIRGDRVVAATCYLPLSDNNNLNKALGTRHRAGVGISEVTDSMTIIVSEETGKVSVAVGGELIHDIDADSLRNKLEYLRRRTIDVKSFKIWRGRLKHEGKDV